MKPFDFAIASIVDANTGFGLQRKLPASSFAAEQHARRLRAKSVIAVLRALGQSLAALPAALRAYQQRGRNVRQIAGLSDRQLDDIGLSRGDVIALQLGVIDLAQLESIRIGKLGSTRLRLAGHSDPRHRISRHASNDALFRQASCA